MECTQAYHECHWPARCGHTNQELLLAHLCNHCGRRSLVLGSELLRPTRRRVRNSCESALAATVLSFSLIFCPNSTFFTRHTPVNVDGLGRGIVSLAVGQTHTCALRADGGVLCWGAGNYGQLGLGCALCICYFVTHQTFTRVLANSEQ